MSDEDEPSKSMGSADDLVPCLGLCCCIYSCYTDWPECCGCRTKYQVFCLSCEGLICKPACTCCGEINPALKKNPKTCCVMNETNCILISPDSCGGGQFQFCCIDMRCAFPPGGIESEVPCVLAILGCTCCFGYKCKPGCCSTLGSLKTSIQDAGAPAEAIEDASDFDAEACASPVRAVAIDDDARQ